jgi:hypothetical protein
MAHAETGNRSLGEYGSLEVAGCRCGVDEWSRIVPPFRYFPLFNGGHNTIATGRGKP